MQGIPAPRGSKKPFIEEADIIKSKQSSSDQTESKESKARISAYDYAAWDKFNVVRIVNS